MREDKDIQEQPPASPADLPTPAASPSLNEVGKRLSQGPLRIIESETDWQQAAVASVFRNGTEGTELLFIQRAAHPDDPWSGQIGFPGGRVEGSDRDPLEAARRETLEEVGLDLLRPKGVRYVRALNQIQARTRRQLLSMVISPYAFLLEGPAEPSPKLILNREVESAFWVPLVRLASKELRIWHHSERDRTPYRFRALDLGLSVPLWGITHRMTLEIRERLGMIDDVDALTLPQLKP